MFEDPQTCPIATCRVVVLECLISGRLENAMAFTLIVVHLASLLLLGIKPDLRCDLVSIVHQVLKLLAWHRKSAIIPFTLLLSPKK